MAKVVYSCGQLVMVVIIMIIATVMVTSLVFIPFLLVLSMIRVNHRGMPNPVHQHSRSHIAVDEREKIQIRKLRQLICMVHVPNHIREPRQLHRWPQVSNGLRLGLFTCGMILNSNNLPPSSVYKSTPLIFLNLFQRYFCFGFASQPKIDMA